MGTFNIYPGQKIGYWIVMEKATKGHGGHARWLCKCECGNERIVYQNRLKKGKSKSCGCHRYDKRKENAFSRDESGKHTKLYGRWTNIKDRCFNPNSKDWDNYGGRGIRMCAEWKNDYRAFESWAISNGYSEDLQIDRIDNNKGYSPDNCRFITPKMNSNNRRNSKKIMFEGRETTIIEISEETGIPWSTLYRKQREGILEEYVKQRRKEKE